MPNQPQQPRFPSVQPRVTNPSTAMITNQATVRLHDPQKFNQRRLPFFSFFEFIFKNKIFIFLASLNSMTYAPTPASIQTIDLPQSYTPQSQQLINSNSNDYLSQSSLPQNRYSNQSSLVSQRLRSITNPNGMKLYLLSFK